ncbi:HD domain-containing phosphohydrolase [Legionella dresdenensis]|uniref:HD domain-containing phosphohydrolase n=1 Tax=Legionella dresdenensis TaxID=450200 RepID=A0ABV8CHC2_9GAMM
MSDKILLVDDEENILRAYQRTLKNLFTIEVATGGAEALEAMAANGPYAVVVSDMRMSGMDGIELFSRMKKLYPETVRVMLTGNLDQSTAVDAVNRGDVFRFLNKPCTVDTLSLMIKESLEKYHMLAVERDVLESTVKGCIEAIVAILSLTKPEIFGNATRLRNHMRRLVKELNLTEMWWYESLALLSQVGCVVVADNIINKKRNGAELSSDETALFIKHMTIGASLLDKIPRMEYIAESIRYQEKNYDGSGFPAGSLAGEDIPLGARLLKVILDYDRYRFSGLTNQQTIQEMQTNCQNYDPEILEALVESISAEFNATATWQDIYSLTDDMILAEDVNTNTGILLLCEGQQCTRAIREHLVTYCNNGSINKMVLVRKAVR